MEYQRKVRNTLLATLCSSVPPAPLYPPRGTGLGVRTQAGMPQISAVRRSESLSGASSTQVAPWVRKTGQSNSGSLQGGSHFGNPPLETLGGKQQLTVINEVGPRLNEDCVHQADVTAQIRMGSILSRSPSPAIEAKNPLSSATGGETNLVFHDRGTDPD